MWPSSCGVSAEQNLSESKSAQEPGYVSEESEDRRSEASQTKQGSDEAALVPAIVQMAPT